MKKIMVLFLLQLFMMSAFSQIKDLKYDSIEFCKQFDKNGHAVYPSMEGKYISTYTFNRLLRRDFSLMTTNEEGLPTIGNYASLKLSDNDTKIALNGSFFNVFMKNGNVKPIKTMLSLGLNASILEGTTSIFSNTSFNDDASLKARFSIINWKHSGYRYNAFDCSTLDLNRSLLRELYYQQDRRDTIIAHQLDHELDSLYKNRDTLITQSLALDDEIQCVKNMSLSNSKEVIDLLTHAKDDVDSRSFTLYDSIMSKRTRLRDAFFDSQRLQIIRDTTFLSKLYAYESKYEKWEAMRVKWFDLFAEMNGATYKILNKGEAIDKQVHDQKFQGYKFGAVWNTFESKPYSPFLKYGYFLKITLQFENGNNIKAANKRDIESLVSIDTPAFNRKVIEKLSAYEQEFKQTFKWGPSVQFSKFLNEYRNRGLSLYMTSTWDYDKFWQPYKISGAPEMSIGAGYFLSILDKDKETALANIEVYLRFLDLGNTGDTDDNVFKRNEIGLKLGLPFRSIFLNQNRY